MSPHDEAHDTDLELAAQVRSQIAGIASHAAALQVEADHGRVILRGPVLEGESNALLRSVAALPGVKEIEDHLETVSHPETRDRLTEASVQPELAQPWGRNLRLGAGIAGVLSLLGATRVRGLARTVLLLLGTSALMRSITNQNISYLLNLIASPLISLRRTMEVSADVDEVFRFWRDFSNYPRFMSFIQSVSVNESGGLQWLAVGPGGVPVRWDTEVSAMTPNQLLSWRSIPGSIIANTGRVRIRSNGTGRTRLELELSYAPPAGAIGYAVAHLLGFDPREKIDEDLQVMKLLIEKQTAKSKVS